MNENLSIQVDANLDHVTWAKNCTATCTKTRINEQNLERMIINL